MMDDYDQTYEECEDYFGDYQPTEESVRLVASMARGEPLSFITEGGAESEKKDNNDRFTELLPDEDQVSEEDMYLHKAAQEFLGTHEYIERTVGDKIPRRMLVKEISAALHPEETFNTRCSDCNGS